MKTDADAIGAAQDRMSAWTGEREGVSPLADRPGGEDVGEPRPTSFEAGLFEPTEGEVASGYLSSSSVMPSRIVRAVVSTRVAVFLAVSMSPCVHLAM
jgi:hypothetical protein